MTPAARLLAALLRSYQRYLSPLLGARCRFHPTCSRYTLEAVERYGAVKGLYLGLRRLGRCHPWSDGGFDEVPERFTWRRTDEPAQGRAA